jgi:hypothetical protein
MKYLIHEVMHCRRGKVPEVLQDLKITNQALLNMGLITGGRFYVDCSDRFDTLVFDQETDSLDKYLDTERGFYKNMARNSGIWLTESITIQCLATVRYSRFSSSTTNY